MCFRWLILLLLLSACSKEKQYGQIQLIGHAGNGLRMSNSIYHDNSKEAVELALSYEGSNGVEVDLQISTDNQLWLYHDPTLETETTGQGCIPSQTSTVLETLQYKKHHQEYLARLTGIDQEKLKYKTLFLDLRQLNSCTNQIVGESGLVQALKSFKKDISVPCEVVLVTNYEPWLDSLSGVGFTLFFSAESMDRAKSLLNHPNCAGFLLKNKAIEKQDVQFLKQANKKVVIFEVRSPKGTRTALKKKPDFLMTDDLRAAIIEKYK